MGSVSSSSGMHCIKRKHREITPNFRGNHRDDCKERRLKYMLDKNHTYTHDINKIFRKEIA